MWQFNYSPSLSKPYFHPVALPGGSCLTWLSPRDHLHHFALFFSWKYLNGVNYWEEPGGVPEGRTVWDRVHVQTRSNHTAHIRMDLHYRPGTGTDVLTEARVIEVSAPEADGSYFMDWNMTFRAGPADVVLDRTPPDCAPDGNARGGYAGLSVRLSRELAKPLVTGDASPGVPVRHRYGFQAAAAEFSGEIDGSEAGITFFEHPANPGSPGRWYAIMDESVPFWFLNAALLQLQPRTLRARDTLLLRYRVAVHPHRWDAARLREERARYAR